jgi:transglutaminase/protease-like cytokinesis protein 3
MNIKKILIFMLILAGNVFNIQAQPDIKNPAKMPNRYYLMNAENWARKTVFRENADTLVLELTARFGNPWMKLRAIYSWIAFNIDYEIPDQNNSSESYSNPEEILTGKKSNSAGFANLMCYLCQRAGLECATISGWSKSTPGDLKAIDWSKPNHSWNAVKINGEWRYCDVAWATGYTKEGDKTKYREKYSDAYFNMPVEKIFLQHYPEDPVWQKEYPMTKAAFDNLPLFYREFFTMNVNDLNLITKKLQKNNPGKLTFRFRTPFAVNSVHFSGWDTSLPFIKMEDQYSITVRPWKLTPVIIFYVNNNPLVAYIAD